MKAALSLIITFLFSSISLAANIYVAPIQGTNVNKSELTTVRELIKVQVQNEQNHQTVNSLEKADYFIQTKLIKFNAFTLSMTKWQGNKKLNSGQWKAKDLSELENIIGTAVKSITDSDQQNSNGSAILFPNNQNSMSKEAEEKRQRSQFEKVQADKQVMIGFGPAYFANMNTSGAGLGFQAGFTWNVDEHFDLALQSDFALSTENSDAFALNGKILTNYFFAAKDISPFIGAGFGYGWASIHKDASITDDSAGGFALSGQAGIKFFRTSTVNFAISAEYTNIFDKTNLGNPGLFILKVALFY